MTPEELLEWADKVRNTVEPEPYSAAWFERFFEENPLPPMPPCASGVRYDCNCPPYGTCMNTACPRRMQFTCGTVRPIESPRSLYDHA